jgi:arsenite methyltransferase
VSVSAAEVKACCSAAYASAAVHWLLGDSSHPGGERLTSRLVEALGIVPGDTVVDVASGRGASALLLARRTGCDVVGIDLSPASVDAANAAAAEAGLASRVRFLLGDAEAVPFADASADGALCECSLCLFPDKQAAASELARVLRAGARLALSDVTARPERLPAELRTLPAWAGCVAGARPLEEIERLLDEAGFAVETAEAHDPLLGELLERVESRLRLGRLLVPELGGRVERGLDLVAAARTALADGALGYGVVVARRR